MELPRVQFIGTDRETLMEVTVRLVRRRVPALGPAMVRTSNRGRSLAWINGTRGASLCLLLRWPARLGLVLILMAASGVLGVVEGSRAAVRAAETPKADPTPPLTIDVIVRAKD